MAKRKRTVEWVGGITSMPSYVTGKGEPFRPEMLIWLNPDGLITGTTLARPGELLGQSAESLRNAIAKPMIGPCPAPTRVRVASAELAEALRAELPSIEVVCAPTPELDQVLGPMLQALPGGDSGAGSYLSGGVEPAAVAAFFRAAARLYRAEPWKLVPKDLRLLEVSVEELGFEDAPLMLFGLEEESFGFVLCEDRDTFEEYQEVAAALAAGEEVNPPPHLSLGFAPGSETAPTLKAEVETHGWEISSPEAYPELLCVGEGFQLSPFKAQDFQIAEALCLALPDILADESWLVGWYEGEVVAAGQVVNTYFGELDLTLSATKRSQADGNRPASEDLLGDLTKLARADEIDPEVHEELQEQLFDRFIASPEAKKLSEVGIVSPLMHYAADYLGETIATLDASGLREVLFDIFPRKVAVPPSEAREIIEELRAFYEFLGRELGLKQAKSCLRVLDRRAVKQLRAGLSDPSNFGMAKSMFMSGVDVGFETEEGFEAWHQSAIGKPVPESVRLPAEPPAPSSRDNKAKKDKTKEKRKRKAARKSRKRNR